MTGNEIPFDMGQNKQRSEKPLKNPDGRNSGNLRPWHYALLLISYVALLIPPIYSREAPELFGFPFFYWYQFAWVILSAALTGVVYWRTRS